MFSELLKNNYRIHRDNKRRLVFFFSDLGCFFVGGGDEEWRGALRVGLCVGRSPNQS